MQMSKTSISLEEQFMKYHNKLRDELNLAYTHHEICKTLRELMKNYLDEFNVAPAFFALTIDAHLFATIMSINRFIDDHANAFKLSKFFKLIEQNPDVFSDEAYRRHLKDKGYDDEDCKHWLENRVRLTSDAIKKDEKIIEKLPVKNLKDWRNKKLAHIDELYVLTDAKISKMSPITSADIDQIIHTLHEILNRYLLAFDGSGWAIGSPACGVSDQIEFILGSIRFSKKSKR
jgi:hypothetical protein